MRRDELLMRYYRAMLEALGPRDWWPANTPFEVCVGAVLVQNTAWTGVKKALANLDAARALDPALLDALPVSRLEELIRPAGYFRVKTVRLKNLLEYLRNSCGFDLDALARRPMEELRGELLLVRGVGPETADSILCYALNKLTFVVDAYTRRILSRHGLVPEDIAYEELREFFHDVLPRKWALYNDFHAQFVRVGNRFCKPRNPLCGECPLKPFLP